MVKKRKKADVAEGDKQTKLKDRRGRGGKRKRNGKKEHKRRRGGRNEDEKKVK